MDRLGTSEDIFEDIGAVEAGREVAAVADVAVDKGVMVRCTSHDYAMIIAL
jgi:hypothetical protein